MRVGVLLLIWLITAFALLAGLHLQPITRTQEARVLETAREMSTDGGRRWLVPELNGRVRMQKPPLGYWFSAAMFEVAGVSRAVGRVPAAVAGWFTLGVTYIVGRRLIGHRGALFAGGALIGSLLFYRHSRLAETDVYVMLFVTLAIASLHRAANEARRGDLRFFHLAAAAMALALLVKGPPALYPLLFLMGITLVERRWALLTRFLKSGALLTFAAIGLPWFVYALGVPEAEQTLRDLRNSAGGGGHRGWFIAYAPQILKAMAPWSGFTVLAVVAAIQRWRSDSNARVLLMWSGSILLPLCLWGNKQPHYLMPLLPPLALLIGWLIEEALSDELNGLGLWMKKLLAATVGVGVVAGGGVVVAAKIARGSLLPLDLVLGGVLTLASITLLILGPRMRLQAFAASFTIAVLLAMTTLVGVWGASLETNGPALAATHLRQRFPAVPLAFYRFEHPALTFELGQVVPLIEHEEALTRTRDPSLHLLSVGRTLVQQHPPGDWASTAVYVVDDHFLHVYRRENDLAHRSLVPAGFSHLGERSPHSAPGESAEQRSETTFPVIADDETVILPSE